VGLFPSAPKVNVYAPGTVFVGTLCKIEIEVVAGADTRIEFVDARVTGYQGWSVGAGKSRVVQRVTFPELRSRLMDAGVLPSGTTRLALQFTLPPGTPPSHQIDPAWANLELRVHVSIPWWPDGRYRFVLPVRVPPALPVIRTPVAIHSKTAAADKPRIEISLASSRLVAGETAVGSCAIFHMDDRKPRDVELSFVPVLTLHGRGRARERRGNPFGVRLTLPAGSAGTSVPFQIALPAAMVPTFETVSHSLSWWLVASSGSFFGGKVDVALPLDIVDASAASLTTKLVAAPRLADERVASLFARFAADGDWQVGEEHALERTAGDADMRISYAYRGQDGTYLVTRLAGPSLGLGLAVTPSSSLRHVFFEDIEVEIATWDRAHLVHARSAAQTIPPLRAIVPTLLEVTGLGKLVRWTDDEIMFERKVLSVELGDLVTTASLLGRVAAALDGARGVVAPPDEVTVDVDEWRELARWLHGRLALGDLSIEDGVLDHARVELGLVFDVDGVPAGVRASVGTPEAASAAARGVTLGLARPAADALAEVVAEGVVDRLTRWPSDITDLHVSDGVATASWVLPAEQKPRVEARRVRELVEALRALLATLDPGAGPYR
jgi:hypothetical protein